MKRKIRALEAKIAALEAVAETGEQHAELCSMYVELAVLEAERDANRDELPNCVWRGAATPFAENH